jgi:hypothetical protein
MENQNQTPQVPQGWKDIKIVPDMPLNALVQFLNILNQRLCTIEDNTFVKDDQGNMLSLTKLYAIQAEEEMRAQMEAAQQEQELRERAE